jgi:cohesin loading factor subunit SCC2
MDSAIIALRSKALKAVGEVVTVDPDILSLPYIRQAIEARLSDPSPAVRDAAVDLVGKYVVQKPNLATEYYPHIAMRVEVSPDLGG